MRLNRLYQSRLICLVLCAQVSGALTPGALSLLHSLAAKPGNIWVQVCSANGTRSVQIPDSGSVPLPGPDAGQHCPYCLSHDDFPAFPVSLILFSPVELAGLGLFLIPRTILTLSKPVWSAPQGRAPPVFS